MRALVTGGAGFIGSNLVDALLDADEVVCAIDNLSTGRRENLNDAIAAGAELVEADITNSDAVDSAIADFAPDVIFHLAGQIDVRKSVANPAFDARVNVEGTINVLESARRNGVNRVVFSSTGGALYGDADPIPTPETHALRPEAPYGQAKVAAEGYFGLFERLYGLSTVVLRYGNVYGPRQDPLGEAGVVAIFCGCLMKGIRPAVFGDGQQTRDYVHVDDVVAANVAAAMSQNSGAYNIGTGKETSVLDLVEALAPHANANFTPVFESARPGELARSALEIKKAGAELGWQPMIELASGLAATLAAAQKSA